MKLAGLLLAVAKAQPFGAKGMESKFSTNIYVLVRPKIKVLVKILDKN